MTLRDHTKVSECVIHRAGIIGDVHCEDEILELVLQHLSGSGADTVLAVGDIVDGAGDANRCCSLLVKYQALTVIGNHDRWFLTGSMRELPDATAMGALLPENRAWLEQLPRTRDLQTSRGALLLCHGIGDDDMAMLRPEDEGYALESNFALQALIQSKRYRFVVCGHSHQPMVRGVGSLIIINAGTLDRRHSPVCGVIDFDHGAVEFFDATNSRLACTKSFALP